LFFKCFAGLSVLNDRICLNPDFPEKWKRVKFHVRYRNVWFTVTFQKKTVKVIAEPLRELSLLPPREIAIEINKKIYQLRPRKPLTIQV
ncbi:MAG: hypothetical protein KAJ18_12210, partial [Candidatus Omnitrophica bacterium]|nr:hypothetical protein [Candidatus Omnitrophota bacterium]